MIIVRTYERLQGMLFRSSPLCIAWAYDSIWPAQQLATIVEIWLLKGSNALLAFETSIPFLSVHLLCRFFGCNQ